MNRKYIPAIITLTSGLVVSIINIINKIELIKGLERLLIVIIIFYVIGLIAKAIIVSITKEKPEAEIEDGKQEDTQEEQTEDVTNGQNKDEKTSSDAAQKNKLH